MFGNSQPASEKLLYRGCELTAGGREAYRFMGGQGSVSGGIDGGVFGSDVCHVPASDELAHRQRDARERGPHI
jgi:hypothetical protein